MIRLQTESKPPPQPFIGVVYRGLCLFRGGNPQNPKVLQCLSMYALCMFSKKFCI